MHLIYDSSTESILEFNSAGKQLEQYVPLITANKKDYFKVHLLDCNTDD